MICHLEGERREGMPRQYRRTWEVTIPPKLAKVRLEEEEDEGSSYEEPTTKAEVRDWWDAFRRQYNYQLYCMIMATTSDDNIATLVEKHRDELSKIAGHSCCFVYFRDLERARLLQPFIFDEHAKGVMNLIDLIDIERNSLPCLLFFEDLSADDYASVRLENSTIPKAIENIRDVFTYIYSNEDVSLAAVKSFRLAKQVRGAAKTVGKGIAGLAKDIIGEFLKSLVTLR